MKAQKYTPIYSHQTLLSTPFHSISYLQYINLNSARKYNKIEPDFDPSAVLKTIFWTAWINNYDNLYELLVVSISNSEVTGMDVYNLPHLPHLRAMSYSQQLKVKREKKDALNLYKFLEVHPLQYVHVPCQTSLFRRISYHVWHSKLQI